MKSFVHLPKILMMSRARYWRNFSLVPDREVDANNQATSTFQTSNSTTARPKLRVKSIVESKPPVTITISDTSTVDQAISHLCQNNLSASLTIDQNGDVSGLFTARDILRYMHAVSVGRTSNKEKSLSHPISEFIVKKDKLIHCSPNDTALRARQVMSQSKIRHIPVIENGEVLGIINIKDLADSSYSIMEMGGKKGFISNITGRKGVPEGTRVRKIDELVRQKSINIPMDVEIGSYALPHPFKKVSTVGASRRDYGAIDLCDDMDLCEDDHFVMTVDGTIETLNHPTTPDSTTTTTTNSSNTSIVTTPVHVPKQHYMCVADGVGSWRQYGVDPRQFSHALVRNAKKTIEMDAMHRENLRLYPTEDLQHGLGGLVMDNTPILPHDIMVDAWNMTLMEKVQGSSTLCIATFDNKQNHLSYTNLGDCGLMIIRHIDSETAGYMRERQLPRHLRKNDLRVAYLAQQQLRSFNFPYQLGFYTGHVTHNSNGENVGKFETPSDADTASIPVMPGDIIVMATDGLFDNLDLNEIVEHVSEWENKWYATNDEDIRSKSAKDNTAINELARTLVEKARTLSLDTSRDSPFAVLAKENDIMWGGGMPDDTSVVVARVYKES